jgi:hypothetical protein
MHPLQKWTFNLLTAAVAATGVAYFVMKYAMQSDDPFSLVNHPWQPAMLHLHVLLAPALIFVFGLVFQAHVGRKIGARGIGNRRSGYLSLVTFAAMTVSGYLLQVVTDPGTARLAMWTHVVTGCVFTIAYTIHLTVSVLMLRSARRERRQIAA